ncbi:MAG: hypothetical protein ABI809_04170 [Caldimonas sp.]
MTRSRFASIACAALAAALGACADRPPAPDWQMNSKSAIERALAAYLAGDTRIEAQEFERVRAEIARTGRPALLARAELVRCASRVASLALEPCAAFDALAADAEPAERAYAAYLAGRIAAADVVLLPEPHRALAVPSATPASDQAALARMTDPLAQLVGAAVPLQLGRAGPGVVGLAVDTASAQGWRRPLLAWLKVQLRQAESAGDGAAVERIRRRIALVGGTPPARDDAVPAASIDDTARRGLG